MTTPSPARYNQTRALLIQIQFIADHAQHVLLTGDERSARHDLQRIQERLDNVRIDLAQPQDHAQPATLPLQSQLAT